VFQNIIILLLYIRYFIQECYNENDNFRSNFLSDAATYPLILIMGGAACLILVFSTNTLISDNNDLRITPSHKQQVIRDWGTEHVDPLAHKLAMGPIIMHGKDYRSLWHEGLGIDHEEWKKQKEADLNASQ
jgi:hypothetical protein